MMEPTVSVAWTVVVRPQVLAMVLAGCVMADEPTGRVEWAAVAAVAMGPMLGTIATCAEARGTATLTASATTSKRSAWGVRGTAIELQRRRQRRNRAFAVAQRVTKSRRGPKLRGSRGS